jgi:uncharacterized protein YbjQ (UPF0145 family)
MPDGHFSGMLVVTTESIPGFQVTVVLGEVCGVAARLRNPYIAGVSVLSGTRDPRRVNEELTNAREAAIEEMVRVARRRGANAVIGMRFDNRDVSNSWAEICAYGTAVRIERARPAPRPVPAMAEDLRPTQPA